MKIVAVMPVRNEDWILGLSARAVLKWADELVILNHASTDTTAQICSDLCAEQGGRVTVMTEPSGVWEEMRHRQLLLGMARIRKATHVAIVDADEVLTGNLLPTVRYLFEDMPTFTVLQFPWLCLRGSISRVHTSGLWANGQNVSTGFVDAPQLHWSSESRGGYDFHHRHPMGRQCAPFTPVHDRSAGLMHLQFVSDRRLRAKQALYKCTEVLRWPDRDPVSVVDQRYNLAVYDQNHAPAASRVESRSTLGAVPMQDWWAAYAPLLHHLQPNAEPWQEAEVHKLIAKHGAQRFAGLDLFGVEKS